MAEDTNNSPALPGAPMDTSGPADVKPAKTFDPSGAPVQVVSDVDPNHPAVDNNPRANTTVNQNKIDFNDPTIDGAEAVARNLAGQKFVADDAEADKK